MRSILIESYENVLKFWFGRVEDTIVPTEHRARIWFGEDPMVDDEIKDRFLTDLEKTITGENDRWEQSARGQLAMIILLDQFVRHVYRNTPLAFANDARALSICVHGVQNESEHHLSLIERVFYYFPLLHSEDLYYQEQAVRSYETLAELAFSETQVIYDSFVKFAIHHHSIINRFGRFPQRNKVLGRVSTLEELEYLSELDQH